MHPFRIAILIFVVGASVANYFAAREYRDRIGAPTPLAATTAAPTYSPEYWNKFWGKVADAHRARPNEQPSPFEWTPVTPDPWAVPSPGGDPYTLRLVAASNDKAWLREAIIVTIAGMAWFLVRLKPVS